MKRLIKTFSEFLNEANLSHEALKFKKGDCIVVKKKFSLSDIDWKKAAYTWWGSNIYAIEREWFKNNHIPFEKNNLLFVFTKDGYVDDKGMGQIEGYPGWAGNSMFCEYYSIRTNIENLSYDNAPNLKMYLLSLLEGLSEVVPYNKVDKKVKSEFENRIFYDRLQTVFKYSGDLTFNGIRIDEYKFMKNNSELVIKGYDIETGEKVDKMISTEMIDKFGIYSTRDDIEITGDPFDEKQQKFNR